MNKKIIKILACSACGLGIATSIPFMATSCGGSSAPRPMPFPEENALPNDVYNIDDTGLLNGFKAGIDWSKYTNYNTMLIPSSVKTIQGYTFNGPNMIPDNIKIIDFSKANCSNTGEATFTWKFKFETLILSSKTGFGKGSLKNLKNLKNFYWDWYPHKGQTYNDVFYYSDYPDDNFPNNPSCTCYSLSEGHDSKEFKEWLNTNILYENKIEEKLSPFSEWTPWK